MDEIKSQFNTTFSHWYICLPPDALANRKRERTSKWVDRIERMLCLLSCEQVHTVATFMPVTVKSLRISTLNGMKFWLDPVRLVSSGGFRSNEIRQIQRLVQEHQAELLRSWNEFFD
jgi:hypothetical protein